MTPPLGFNLLAHLTGLANGRDAELVSAYTVAVGLANHPPHGANDCDTTYKAIGKLIADVDPSAHAAEGRLERVLTGHHHDDYAQAHVARTDLSFLLGFAYCFVLLTAVSGRLKDER